MATDTRESYSHKRSAIRFIQAEGFDHHRWFVTEMIGWWMKSEVSQDSMDEKVRLSPYRSSMTAPVVFSIPVGSTSFLNENIDWRRFAFEIRKHEETCTVK